MGRLGWPWVDPVASPRLPPYRTSPGSSGIRHGEHHPTRTGDGGHGDPRAMVSRCGKAGCFFCLFEGRNVSAADPRSEERQEGREKGAERCAVVNH